ncbi:MAG: hypothetical protein HY821_05470 [Acidobacteria bacterium]|nr:hypothetical protein [Acidobacteriota bacterium]
MTRACALLLPAVLALAACSPYPAPIPPPPQRAPFEADHPQLLKHHFSMSEATAYRYILVGVLPLLGDGGWRWTEKRAIFQFQLPSTQNLIFNADITVPDVSFQQTGPVNITIRIDGHLLDTVHFDRDEKRLYRKPVPAAWLTTARPVQVTMEIDKLMRTADNKTWGFIVTSLGFSQ